MHDAMRSMELEDQTLRAVFQPSHRQRLKSLALEDGETRQIFAWDTKELHLFKLPERGGDCDRGGEELRARCADGELICPLPDEKCPNRRFTVVRGKRRHHFRHAVDGAGNHAPETWFHWCGKYLIGDWLRMRYGVVPDIDTRRLENNRRPDVCAVIRGHPIAFEVQYRLLQPDKWLKRHNDIKAGGWTPVWLFGHLRSYLLPDRTRQRAVVTDLLAEVAGAGVPIRWIWPDQRRIGTGWNHAVHKLGAHCRVDDGWRWRSEEVGFRRLPNEDDDTAEVAVEGLDDCTIEEGRFLTPTSIALDEQIRSAQARQQYFEAEETAYRREVREKEKNWQLDVAGRRAAWEAQFHWGDPSPAVRAQRRDADLKSWEKDPNGDCAWLWQKYGKLEPILTEELPSDGLLQQSAARWHTRFFRTWMRVGRRFTIDRVVAALLRGKDSIAELRLRAALVTYLFHLRKQGYVEFDHTYRTHFSQGIVLGEIKVLADLDHEPQINHWTEYHLRKNSASEMCRCPRCFPSL